MTDLTYLGEDTDPRFINDPVFLEDDKRLAGTYILGKSGMGKTNMLLKLALHDIEEGHGLFFLDPHGDAIKEILMHGELKRLKDDAIVLNPELEDYAFGVNLTYCPNLQSLTAQVDTYTKAYNVFKRAFAQEWGPWLQLIIQNTLYAFIENQEHTLAEAPRFLLDGEFRQKLVSNMKYNPEVVDFWRYRFSQRRERDQEAQVDAALTRFSTFLGHPYIRDIIGQRQTTVDFTKFMRERRIVLLKLSANLAEDIKGFIGTILVSELLHAVRQREELPIGERTYFSVFVDEFQNFATEDFAALITEGRKFGVATTIAHQERFGQLRENPKVLGATLACANKIIFQLTVRDAAELAPEFAEFVSETKTGREAELVISPHAVEDIWEKGHPNKGVMDIRKRYFWIVDLLRKQYPEKDKHMDIMGVEQIGEAFYRFDPERFTTGLAFEKYDWSYYRATEDMVARGIEQLDNFYCDVMRGDTTPPDIMPVIENLGGLFGFWWSMHLEREPYQVAMSPQEYRLKKVTSTTPGRVSTAKTAYQTKWKKSKLTPDERRIITRLSSKILARSADADGQAFLRSFYQTDTKDKLDQSIWRAQQLVDFIGNLFVLMPMVLKVIPVKIPSSKYDEQVRVERMQQDLINEMAMKLTDLAPYVAYTKIVRNLAGELTTVKSRTRTQKVPHGTMEAEIRSSGCYTEREEIHRQIAKRLSDAGQKQRSRQNPPPTFIESSAQTVNPPEHQADEEKEKSDPQPEQKEHHQKATDIPPDVLKRYYEQRIASPLTSDREKERLRFYITLLEFDSPTFGKLPGD